MLPHGIQTNNIHNLKDDKEGCTWKSLSPGLVGAGLLDVPPWLPLPALSVELWLI